MSRIAAWLAATVVLMIFLIGYQVTVAGVGGQEVQRAPVQTGTSAPASPAASPEDSHPPK
jgi:hypothetical protein